MDFSYQELRTIRLKLGLNLKEMSELLSTPYRTYQDWENGNRRIPGVCQEAVYCFMSCKSALKKRLKMKKLKGGKKKMGREIVLFKTEEPKSISETAQFLRLLADKLEKGDVTLKGAGQEINLQVPTGIILETKVEEETKKGRTKRSLEVELEWYLGEETGHGGVTIE